MIAKEDTFTQWSDHPSERLKQLNSLNEFDQKQWLTRIAPPEGFGTWPYGMPTSAAPLWVAIGLSPGAGDGKKSPAPATNEHPTFGVEPGAHPNGRLNDPCCYGSGLFWNKKTDYFDKVRDLFIKLGQIYDPTLNPAECLALSGHLNLGTGQSGNGSEADLEPKIIEWVSRLLFNHFRPAVIVLFGWKGSLRKIESSWTDGGFCVDWNSPNKTILFQPRTRKCYFRTWVVKDSFEREVRLIMWPNHPRRYPFRSMENWKKSLDCLPDVLKVS